jgi:hypothetical protein
MIEILTIIGLGMVLLFVFRRGLIHVDYSMPWLFALVAFGFLSTNDSFVDWAGKILGVTYAPNRDRHYCHVHPSRFDHRAIDGGHTPAAASDANHPSICHNGTGRAGGHGASTGRRSSTRGRTQRRPPETLIKGPLGEFHEILSFHHRPTCPRRPNDTRNLIWAQAEVVEDVISLSTLSVVGENMGSAGA